MRIAQISPLIESVPPKLYGGTERMVSWLTEELVTLGHDVTLFASGDSVTSAELVPCCEEALRLDPNVKNEWPHLMRMLDTVRTAAYEFDILHFHVEVFPFPLFKQMAPRTVTTLHSRQDGPDMASLFKAFPQMPVAAISNAQAKFIPDANVVGTIHHGLPENLFRPNYRPSGEYLAFLGRMSPEKRPDRAIAIARALGIPLKMAAKVDNVDKTYFNEVVKPLIDNGDGVEFIGEVNEHQKQEFLGNAQALLFPIDWPEPFGLVMIEAMACGTPVLAFKNGSVPEVIDTGYTGKVVTSVEEAVRAYPEVAAIDRRTVRRTFEQRFTAARMAKDYVKLYRKLLAREREQAVTIKANGPGVGIQPEIDADRLRA